MAIAIFYASTAIAQKADNFDFLAIPLGGPATEIKNQLAQKGFRLLSTYKDARKYKGKYEGEECTLTTFTTDEGYIEMMEVFLHYPDWNTLKEKYYHFKNIFSEKYTLYEAKEEFTEGHFFRNELEFIKRGKCNYKAEFYIADKIGDGSAKISIDWFDGKPYVIITYFTFAP